jgi:hypothetical protein
MNGFNARITTHEVALPCAPTATFPAFMVAWTGILHSAHFHWAQTGYAVYRFGPTPTVNFQRYTEIKAGPNPADYRRTWFPAPTAGAHSYKGELVQPATSSSSSSSGISSSSGAPTTGTWNFYYDGVLIDTWSHIAWRTKLCDRVDYNIEIHDLGTPAPGIVTAKCKYDQCTYKVRGSAAYTSAGLTAAQIRSSQPARYRFARISGSEFDVWNA